MPETESEDGDAAPTDEGESPRADEHLKGLEDGAGCAEIWERLSERRASDD